jgi:FAD/FMN-containing dehydrogenase
MSLLESTNDAAQSFTGRLLRPSDEDFDDLRRVHNGLIDKHPALIARCGGVADIVEAVTLARREGLEVAVRGGGHNVAGHATVDQGLLIDLHLGRLG